MSARTALQQAEPGGALLAWLALLPAAVLALPGPLAAVAHDPYPHLAGAGWALLAALPAAALLVRTGARAGLELGLLLALLALAALHTLRALPDPFEATRALCQLGALGVAFAAGLRLNVRGRRVLVTGAVALSATWTAVALAGAALAPDGHLAGVLGDTGSLSQAALPGAVLGAWLGATRRGLQRALGLVAAVGFLVHAALAPVLAGGLIFGLVLIAGALAAPLPQRFRPTRRVLGGLAAAGLFGLIFLRGLPAEPAEVRAAPEVAAPAAGRVEQGLELGGVEVRARVGRRVLALAAHRPLLGTGPGQFQAVFPAWRDPREAELARHGDCEAARSEVEHAHSDPLQALAELGLPGGLAWLALLALLATPAVRGVRLDDPRANALGLAALAVLLNSLVHAPLLANPAAGPLAFALFGALLGRSSSDPPRRPFGALLLLAALAMTPAAVRLVRHGDALTDHLAARRALAANPRDGDAWLAAKRTVDAALAVAPRSAEARRLLARTVRTDDERLAAWDALLEVRPASLEALDAGAILLAQRGALAAARARLERLLALAPSDPGALRNLARLELRDGDPERGLALVAALGPTGCADGAWRRGLGADLLLRHGRADVAARLLAGAPLGELAAERLHDAYLDETSELTPLVRDAHEALAQLLWARQHAAAGAFELALRNYRQALRQSAAWNDGGAVPLRLELAAAELLAGRAARDGGVVGLDDPRTLAELPAWARDALGR